MKAGKFNCDISRYKLLAIDLSITLILFVRYIFGLRFLEYPAFAPKINEQTGGNENHHRYRYKITVSSVQLGNVIKIHSVNSGD